MEIEPHAEFLGEVIGPVQHRDRASAADCQHAAAARAGRFQLVVFRRQGRIGFQDDRVAALAGLRGNRQQVAAAEIDVAANLLGGEPFREGGGLGANDHGRCRGGLTGNELKCSANGRSREPGEIALHGRSPKKLFAQTAKATTGLAPHGARLRRKGMALHEFQIECPRLARGIVTFVATRPPSSISVFPRSRRRRSRRLERGKTEVLRGTRV